MVMWKQILGIHKIQELCGHDVSADLLRNSVLGAYTPHGMPPWLCGTTEVNPSHIKTGSLFLASVVYGDSEFF